MTRLVVVVVAVLACACVMAANVQAAGSGDKELVAEWHFGGKGE